MLVVINPILREAGQVQVFASDGLRTLSEFVILGLELTQGVALGWKLANAFGVGQAFNSPKNFFGYPENFFGYPENFFG